jgi:prepilin-type N-terminal cleavage/methylation domain-containing protein
MIVAMLEASRGRTDSPGRCGVTLIEVMISIVLVSTVLLVSLTASSRLLHNEHLQDAANDGAQLAAQLLDEVSSMDFRDRNDPVFGLEADETATDRTGFDDVDDYDGYECTPPTYRDGTSIEGYEGWSCRVTITPADPSTEGITTVAAGERSPLRIIAVLCTAADGTTTEATTLVSNVPSGVADTASYERWRRVKLTFPDREFSVTAPLRNRPDPTY